MSQNEDLISRSALLKRIEEKRNQNPFYNSSTRDAIIWDDYFRDFASITIHAPAVDAVEVVRCKDCDFSRHIYQENGGVFRGTLHCAHGRGYQMNTPDREYSVVSPNSYCAAGKRKIDAEVHDDA